MAFENINWGMLPAQRNRDQEVMLQAIGQGIGNYQQGQDRDLKRRQLDIAANEKKKTDFKNLAMQGLHNQSMGLPVTPEQMAAIDVMKQTTGDSQFVDPVTKQVITVKSPWKALGGNSGAANPMQASQAAIMDRQANIGANPNQRPELQVSDFTPMNTQDIENAITSEDPLMLNTPEYKAGGILAGTPRGAELEEESRRDTHKEKVKAKIDESKEQRAFMLAKQRNRPKEERGMYNAAQEYGVVNNLIDKAIGQTTDWTTGVTGLLGRLLPATDASDMSATLKSIKADKMLSRLTELKKEGGTLGALAAKEQEALENALASLDEWQSKEQLIDGLNRYRAQRQDSVRRVFKAYEDDYGEVPQDIANMFAKNLSGSDAPNDYKTKYGLE